MITHHPKFSFLFILTFLVCNLLWTNSLAQTFDYSYYSGNDSVVINLELIEGRTDGDLIGLGKNRITRLGATGTIIWAKQIDCTNFKSLRLDSDNNIYYLFQRDDINSFTHSYIVKLDPEGNQIWQKKIGDGFYEVEVNDMVVEGSDYFYVVGRMNNDTSIFSFVAKFHNTGTLDWARRLHHYTATYSTLIKIDQAPGGYLYLLGQRDDKTTVFEFHPDAAMSGFYQYWTADSLLPVDIVAYSDNDIQVLMNKYKYDDIYPEHTLVKMQMNANIQIVTSKEYSFKGAPTYGVDLECIQERCFIMANKSEVQQSTIIEKTNMEGEHVLIRDIYDQDTNQYGYDMEIRSDQSVILTYSYDPDSSHIVSATNQYMQSNCDFHFGETIINDISLTTELAIALAFSAAFPIVSSSPSAAVSLADLFTINHCFGVASIAEKKVSELKIYPNPFTDKAIVEFQNPSNEKHELFFYNTLGQLVFSISDIYAESVTITSNELKSGMYFLRLVKDGELVASEKVMLK